MGYLLNSLKWYSIIKVVSNYIVRCTQQKSIFFCFSDISHEARILGKSVQIGGVAARLTIVNCEMIMYVILFQDMSKSNERLRNSLSKKLLQNRRKKNAINLKSQIMSFCVETGFLVFILIAHIIAKKFHFSPSALHTLGIVEVALSNITLLISSPELRRRYFGADDVWVPNW